MNTINQAISMVVRFNVDDSCSRLQVYDPAAECPHPGAPAPGVLDAEGSAGGVASRLL